MTVIQINVKYELQRLTKNQYISILLSPVLFGNADEKSEPKVFYKSRNNIVAHIYPSETPGVPINY